jgi:hypothetical protein
MGIVVEGHGGFLNRMSKEQRAKFKHVPATQQGLEYTAHKLEFTESL